MAVRHIDFMEKKAMKRLKMLLDCTIYATGLLTVLGLLFHVMFVEKGYYHADCTDSIMWAQATLEGKALVDPGFIYAGIMPFAGNIIFLPFVAIFGFGMKAQIAGMVTFYIIFVLALVWLCKQLKFTAKWTSVTLASVLLIVSSSEKLREIFWGHIIYYSFGALIMILAMAATIKSLKIGRKYFIKATANREKKYIISLVILLFVSALGTLNGMQIAVLGTIPVVAALIAEMFFDIKNKIICKENYFKLTSILMMVLGTILGEALNKLVVGNVKASYADAFSGFSDQGLWVENFEDFFPGLFKLVGIEHVKDLTLFGVGGIFILLKIFCVFILILAPVAAIPFYRKLKKLPYRIVFLSHHLLTIMIMVVWIFGKANSAVWRLSPILVSSTVTCVILVKRLFEMKRPMRLSFMISIPIMCVAFITSAELAGLEKQSEKNMRLSQVAEFLEENDLHYGYASFWNANIITMMTDSKVKVRNVNIEGSSITPYFYQARAEWFVTNPNQNNYFILMTNQEYMDYEQENNQFNFGTPEGRILQYGNYWIIVYDHNIF